MRLREGGARVDGVCVRVAMYLLDGVASWRELDVECCYRPEDPYAVRLDFGAGEQGAVWLLSRETLAAGLRGPAGDGDVHIAPSEGGDVFIALGGGAGVALLTTPAGALARFLAATDELVPAGTEASRINWDRCIQEFLSI
ncbi:SsgA family sporulation/cell division regulator [Streptomyces sp. NPDC056975]|uniref:SsgA family sporulation/cell division regulator n=2 Tax=unclassified Streptomyces TaxID=2593676 RepID=UPI00362A8091